jgi:hypothetical protein
MPEKVTPPRRLERDGGAVADLEPDTFAALAGRCAVFRVDPV